MVAKQPSPHQIPSPGLTGESLNYMQMSQVRIPYEKRLSASTDRPFACLSLRLRHREQPFHEAHASRE